MSEELIGKADALMRRHRVFVAGGTRPTAERSWVETSARTASRSAVKPSNPSWAAKRMTVGVEVSAAAATVASVPNATASGSPTTSSATRRWDSGSDPSTAATWDGDS